MAILFSQNSIVKSFDNDQLHRPRIRKIKTKEFDGPNNFSLLWNQLIILCQNKLITDSKSLKTKYNPRILKMYSRSIHQEIDIILYKFEYLNMKSITLYYDTYRLTNDLETITKLYDLKILLMDL